MGGLSGQLRKGPKDEVGLLGVLRPLLEALSQEDTYNLSHVVSPIPLQWFRASLPLTPKLIEGVRGSWAKITGFIKGKGN